MGLREEMVSRPGAEHPIAKYAGLSALVVLFVFLSLILPVKACFAGECKEVVVTAMALTESTKGSVEQQWPASSQLIVVRNDGPLPHISTLHALEKKDGTWTPVFGPVRVMAGPNGFAEVDGKREGDGRTPVGIYPLGLVFGYPSSVVSAMPYRRMTLQDIWVDDPDSPDYNHLKKRVETTARSFENMVLPDDRYKYGIVIEYNTKPVIPGRGSAIFLHIWKNDTTPTAGCVAMSEENILKLINWLDPAKKPLIVIEK
jgi:L,D-peptidoglycan transpeptidase YkuD (ErfK/YbiS/YcfS/YnhG family)